jgi:hypothetical protein
LTKLCDYLPLDRSQILLAISRQADCPCRISGAATGLQDDLVRLRWLREFGVFGGENKWLLQALVQPMEKREIARVSFRVVRDTRFRIEALKGTYMSLHYWKQESFLDLWGASIYGPALP